MNGKVTQQSSKEEQWRQRLARFATSGQQVKTFCQAESVSEAVFYRWRKQLSAAGAAVPAADFIDVGTMPSAPKVKMAAHCESTSAALEIRLDLGHGLVLQIVRR